LENENKELKEEVKKRYEQYRALNDENISLKK